MALAGIALLLATGCSEGVAPDNTEPSDIKPQLVVQVGHSVPVEAVAWARDGKNLISLGIDGSLVVWEVGSHAIVNRAKVPVDWRDKGLASDEGYTAEGYKGQRCIRLDDFMLSGAVLTVAYREDRSQFLDQAGEEEPADKRLAKACPGYSASGNRRFEFALDVETWQEVAAPRITTAKPKPGGAIHQDEVVRPAAFSKIYDEGCIYEGRCKYQLQDEVTGVDGADLTRFFPPSPDGTIVPRPNFDDGKPGYASIYADRGPLLSFETCTSINFCRFGINLYGPEIVTRLTGQLPSYFRDADVSADGRQVVRVALAGEDTTVDVLDLQDGRASRTLALDRPYHRVRWLSPGRYSLYSDGSTVSPMMREMMRRLPPVLVVDPKCGPTGRCASADIFSGIEPIDDAGGFLGIASLDGCHATRYPSRFAISRVECESGNGVEIVNPDGSLTTRTPSADFPQTPLADSLSIHPAPEAGGPPSSWQRIAVPGLHPGEAITAIGIAPDRQTLVVATYSPNEGPILGEAEGASGPTVRILAFDSPPDAELLPPRLPPRVLAVIRTSKGATTGWRVVLGAVSSSVRELRFTPDSRHVIFAHKRDAKDTTYLYSLLVDDQAPSLFAAGEDGKPHNFGFGLGNAFPFASEVVVAVGNEHAFGLDNLALISLDDGSIVHERLADQPMVRAGYIAPSNLLWGASADGTIRYWDAADGQLQMTLYTLPGNKFFVVSPGGRYDTNLPPDSNQIRWLMADKPWQSLASQTFMRDYYEPGMYREILECREHADTCETPFRKPLPSIESLNRVLPTVRIASVMQTVVGGSAIVVVDVTPGRDDAVDSGAPQGIYNLRLFRNGRLVATDPFFINHLVDGDSEQDDSVEQWRSDNVLPHEGGLPPKGKLLANGDYRMIFTVPLPTGLNPQRQVFSAYAFNEDRIKSATAYSRPARAQPSPKRQGRAYVINIGIDHYDREKMRLRFAGNDARLLSDRLSEIPGYEVRNLVLTAEDPKLGTGTARHVGRYTILKVLGLLHDNPFREVLLKSLREDGIDASLIEPATPDDIVIISYSGHGDTDKFGNFYLIPSDGTWAYGDDINLETLVSAADLSNALSRNQAGEIALIIDACRSAASVEAGDFKPVPVGDGGLGQLAYDKGILVLSAAQSTESAMEDGKLKQGLVTFALAANGEGLSTKGDRDRDGSIRLDEWLQYAVDRLPGLDQDRRHLLYDENLGRFVAARGSGKKKTQTPALFNFNPGASPVVIRRALAG